MNKARFFRIMRRLVKEYLRRHPQQGRVRISQITKLIWADLERLAETERRAKELTDALQNYAVDLQNRIDEARANADRSAEIADLTNEKLRIATELLEAQTKLQESTDERQRLMKELEEQARQAELDASTASAKAEILEDLVMPIMGEPPASTRSVSTKKMPVMGEPPVSTRSVSTMESPVSTPSGNLEEALRIAENRIIELERRPPVDNDELVKLRKENDSQLKELEYLRGICSGTEAMEIMFTKLKKLRPKEDPFTAWPRPLTLREAQEKIKQATEEQAELTKQLKAIATEKEATQKSKKGPKVPPSMERLFASLQPAPIGPYTPPPTRDAVVKNIQTKLATEENYRVFESMIEGDVTEFLDQLTASLQSKATTRDMADRFESTDPVFTNANAATAKRLEELDQQANEIRRRLKDVDQALENLQEALTSSQGQSEFDTEVWKRTQTWMNRYGPSVYSRIFDDLTFPPPQDSADNTPAFLEQVWSIWYDKPRLQSLVDAQWKAKNGNKRDEREEATKLSAFLTENDYRKMERLYSDAGTIGPCHLNMRDAYRLTKFLRATRKSAPNSPQTIEWERHISAPCRSLFQDRKLTILLCIGTKTPIAGAAPASATARVSMFDDAIKTANGLLCAAMYYNLVTLKKVITGFDFPGLFESKQKTIAKTIANIQDLPCVPGPADQLELPLIDSYLDR